MQTHDLTPAALAQFFDHTLLKADARREALELLCQEARNYKFRAVCVNSYWLPLVRDLLAGSESWPISVVGFPLGAMSVASKIYETSWCVDQGAREIDTVANLGAYFSGDEKTVRTDIAAVVAAAGNVPVKVIIETAYLNAEQIAKLAIWSAEEGAAFVKTSTGFASRGASIDDIKTMRQALDAAGHHQVKLKASGGVRNLDFTLKLIEAGADRVGASASVSILNELRT